MNSRTGSCPECEAGELQGHTRSRCMEKNGLSFTVNDIEYSVCEQCGFRTVTAEQSRVNKRKVAAARKHAMGLLTGDQIRALRERLGINQAQAATMFGGGRNAFSKYETETVTQSDAMDRLLRVADALPPAFAWLAKHAGEDALAKQVSDRYLSEALKQLHRLFNTPIGLPKAASSPSKVSQEVTYRQMHKTPANDFDFAQYG